MGGSPGTLEYIALSSLIELKLAAGRSRDETDIVELLRSDPAIESEIAHHLAGVHPDYVARFRELAARARAEQNR
jgi:hypothetical protein